MNYKIIGNELTKLGFAETFEDITKIEKLGDKIFVSLKEYLIVLDPQKETYYVGAYCE